MNGYATPSAIVAAARAETTDFAAVKALEAAGITVRFVGVDRIEAQAGNIFVALTRGGAVRR